MRRLGCPAPSMMRDYAAQQQQAGSAAVGRGKGAALRARGG